MQRSASAKSITSSPLKASAAVREIRPVAVAEAAEAMWVYYRDHKAQLIADIKDFRAGILAQLMAGESAADVFAPYFRPAEQTIALKRAA